MWRKGCTTSTQHSESCTAASRRGEILQLPCSVLSSSQLPNLQSPHPTPVPSPPSTAHLSPGMSPCSNVLLDSDLRACLGDMSMARMVGSKARSAAGFCCTHAGASPRCTPDAAGCWLICMQAACLTACTRCLDFDPTRVLLSCAASPSRPCSPRAADGVPLHPGGRHVRLWHPAGGADHSVRGGQARRVAPATRAGRVPSGGCRGWQGRPPTATAALPAHARYQPSPLLPPPCRRCWR